MATAATITSQILALPTKVFVDIGASNVPGESQTECLLEHGWRGVMFECNPEKYAGLRRRMAGRPVTVISEKATPETIVEHLRRADAPSDFFLSLDIDGYDYEVLAAILGAYRPALIVSEINEKIPPPIKFSVQYRPDYWWDTSHFYGYSISMLDDLLPQYGYKIDDLHYNNVILSPGTQTRSTQEIYNEGYLNRHDRRSLFYYNADVEQLYSMSYEGQLEFIRSKFSAYDGQYRLDGRIHVHNTGQIQLTQPFGAWISRYAADTRFSKYLEVGTWNGRGSTCCFYEGFAQRGDSPTLQSYEIDAGRAAEAAALWGGAPQIQIRRGRVLPDSECPVYDEVVALFPQVNRAWHDADIRNFWSCPHRPIENPEVVLLDGAEYLTRFEFERVFKECPSVRVYLLDDIATAKNPHVNSTLLNHPDWTRVAYSDTERNGWAVFERITGGTS